MLIQALLLIATTVVLAGALLTSTLVGARSAFHRSVQTKSEAALIDATGYLAAWARAHVASDGLNRTSVWSAEPQQKALEPLCARATPDAAPATAQACDLYAKISWNVTGYTGDAQAGTQSAGLSEANALASAQDEQRISATITAAITDASGTIVYAEHSREVTARLFHAFPYFAITGTKDVSSASGSVASSEGDTAGRSEASHGDGTEAQPSSSRPAAYTDTVITTTIDCANTAQNRSPDPRRDNVNVNFVPVRDYGNVAWTYEVPCRSAQRIDPGTVPAGYVPPANDTYSDRSHTAMEWAKRDGDASSFAR